MTPPLRKRSHEAQSHRFATRKALTGNCADDVSTNAAVVELADAARARQLLQGGGEIWVLEHLAVCNARTGLVGVEKQRGGCGERRQAVDVHANLDKQLVVHREPCRRTQALSFAAGKLKAYGPIKLGVIILEAIT